jgi:hypothetical protein
MIALFLRTYWRQVAGLALILAAGGYLVWIHADRDHWRGEAETWKVAAARYKAAHAASESRRAAEAGQAVKAVSEAEIACDARVAQARRSAQAIRTIIEREVPRDPNGCPVRQLVDPDSLRDALRPAG